MNLTSTPRHVLQLLVGANTVGTGFHFMPVSWTPSGRTMRAGRLLWIVSVSVIQLLHHRFYRTARGSRHRKTFGKSWSVSHQCFCSAHTGVWLETATMELSAGIDVQVAKVFSAEQNSTCGRCTASAFIYHVRIKHHWRQHLHGAV